MGEWLKLLFCFVFVVLGFVGLLCVIAAFPAGVGVFIYGLAHDVNWTLSLWNGFLWWLCFSGFGLAAMFSGMVYKAICGV